MVHAAPVINAHVIVVLMVTLLGKEPIVLKERAPSKYTNAHPFECVVREYIHRRICFVCR